MLRCAIYLRYNHLSILCSSGIAYPRHYKSARYSSVFSCSNFLINATMESETCETWRQSIVSFVKQPRDPEFLVKVFQSLETGKNSEAGSESASKVVRCLTEVCSNKEFIGAIQQCILSASSSPVLGSLLTQLHSFCAEVFQKVPQLGKDTLFNLIYLCVGVLAGNSEIQASHPNLLHEFSNLQKQIDELGKLALENTKPRRRFEFSEDEEYVLHSFEPPEDFREVPVIPTLHELLHETDPFLRPNKAKGAYRNAEHYLDVQYRLLREDFVRPLRVALQDFMKNRDEFIQSRGKRRQNREQDSSVRLYTDLYFNSVEESRENDKHHLFNLPARLAQKVNWDKSKRLLPGCLVVLTSDYFKTAIFGITLLPPFDPKKREKGSGGDQRRQELANGVLRLTIESGAEFVKENQTYLMFECEAFFEAYRYNLGILQTTKFLDEKDEKENRMARYIVHTSPDVELPTYLRVNPGLLLSPTLILPLESGEEKLDPLTPDLWPAAEIQETMQLDADQYLALRTALTSELAVIQGPPGTGKTYVGLKIVETLLEGEIFRSTDSPLLILCYTNHALDQFLELLLEKMPLRTVVRVGGQSKSAIVQQHTLAEHRRKVNYSHRRGWDRDTYAHELRVQKNLEADALAEVQRLESSLRKLNQEIAALKNPCGIFSFQELVIGSKLMEMLPGKLKDYLRNTDWLGITNQIFRKSDFDVGLFMSRSFTIKPRTTSVYKKKLRLSHDLQEHVEEDKKEEFEYDLDELMEQRMLVDDPKEDAEQEIDSGCSQSWDMYISNSSTIECDVMLKRGKEHLTFLYNCIQDRALRSKHFREEDAYDRISIGLKSLRADKLECENRAALLSAIFGLLREERLVIPDVSQIFHKVNEGERYVVGNPQIRYPVRLKWGLYFKIVEMARELSKECKMELEQQLTIARKEYLEARNLLDGSIVKDADIVGMTTTGAAKMHELLEIAKPEIVVVEEAAEILESHVVTSLTEHCKHLILIGDHQQLRPSASIHELLIKYRLNVSLFERMINNGVSLCTLKTQHRMQPEISNLIIGSIYDELRNHEKVYSYPKVLGTQKSLFFITHKEPEETDTELMSKSNNYEAQFLIGLCDYLLRQGYKHNQITVLTTYTGQMFLLKKLAPQHHRGVRITCVDNFQGEENDIILLSLVRSNDEEKVGFVGIENRICVSLSRARHGLFVVGNMTAMANASGTWRKIHQKLKDGNNIGDTLELICTRHGNVTRAKYGHDFNALINGGCMEMCLAELQCDHQCLQICHVDDPTHERYQCQERCNKTCDLGHACKSACFVKCPNCKILVEKTLPCNHSKTLPCWINVATVDCRQEVPKTMDCASNHVILVECYKDIADIKCPVMMEKVLPCGHVRLAECWIPEEDIICDVSEERILPCNHTKQLKCYQSSIEVYCEVIVDNELDCGHKMSMKCGRSVNSVKCLEKVEKELGCGHKKMMRCHQSTLTATCDEEVDEINPDCLHVQRKRCSSDDTRCTEICNKELKCGHKCRSRCHVNDDPDHTYRLRCRENCKRSCARRHPCKFKHECSRKCLPCEVPVKMMPSCGHQKKVECSKVEHYSCKKRVKKTLSCGHEQHVLCQAKLEDQKCSFPITDCTKTCALGHKCSIEHACHETCPPCAEKVEKTLECDHTVMVPCHDDGKESGCLVKVPKTLGCGHWLEIECYLVQENGPISCTEKIRWQCTKCNAEENIVCSKKPGSGLCRRCRNQQNAEARAASTYREPRGWGEGGRNYRGRRYRW